MLPETMTSPDFRLPPLDGDDVVVRLERDLLKSWGFLDNRNRQQTTLEDHDPGIESTPEPADGNAREIINVRTGVTGAVSKNREEKTAANSAPNSAPRIESLLVDELQSTICAKNEDGDADAKVVSTSETDTDKSKPIESDVSLDKAANVVSVQSIKVEEIAKDVSVQKIKLEEIAKDVSVQSIKVEDIAKDVSVQNINKMEETAKDVSVQSIKVEDIAKDVSVQSIKVEEIAKDVSVQSINKVEEIAKDVSVQSINKVEEIAKDVSVQSINKVEEIAKDVSVQSLDCNDGSIHTNTNIMSERAQSLYDQAYEAYGKRQFCESLIYVDEALELDDVGWDVDLWLLHAKVMNSMEDYRGALSSAYKVKAEDRPSRLWIEGAIGLEKLGLLATAENWVARAMQTCHYNDVSRGLGNDVIDILDMMRRRLRIQRVFGPLIKDKPIRVTSSSRSNRVVTATRDIQKAEVIFQELPEMLEQSIKSHRLTACAGCAKSLLQPHDVFKSDKVLSADLRKAVKKLWPKVAVVGCKACKEVKYCSVECREVDWNSSHAVVCPFDCESTASMLYDVRRSFTDVIAADGSSWQGWWNTEFSPTFLARLWASVVCRAKRLADLGHKESYTTSDWLMAESSLEKYSTSPKFKENCESIPKMLELLGSIFKRSKIMRIPITQEEFNKRYSQLAINVVSFHDPINPAAIFQDEISKDTKLKKKYQNHVKSTRVPVAEFHGLFPLTCCLNHSCVPNAELTSTAVQGRPGLSVRAVTDIKAGEEIVVAYVDPRLERTERRSQIWRKYKFICLCGRCLEEGRGPDKCTQCGKSAKSGSKSKTQRSPLDIDNNTLNATKSQNEPNRSDHDGSGGNGDGRSKGDQLVTKEPKQVDHLAESNPRTGQDGDGHFSATDASGQTETAIAGGDQRFYGGSSVDQSATSSSKQPPSRGVVIEDDPIISEECPEPRLKLKMCGRCKRAWYCSVECQKKAWINGHKNICMPM